MHKVFWARVTSSKDAWQRDRCPQQKLMIIRYKHTFNNMFDNKVATKIARIWNPLQLCGNPFRAFRLNFIMVNCKNCMACSCNQTVYHPINYSSSDIFNILSRQVLWNTDVEEENRWRKWNTYFYLF